jgi:hypothetical protein
MDIVLGLFAIVGTMAMIAWLIVGLLVFGAELGDWLRRVWREGELATDSCYSEMRDGTCWMDRLDECEARDCCAECWRQFGFDTPL